MFTGIITATARIKKLSRQGGIVSAVIQKPRKFKVYHGESISVNGICSTVVRASGGTLTFEYMAETLRKTNIGSLKSGDLVNLEQSLAWGGRLHGHFVTGHVDTRGTTTRIRREGNSRVLRIKIPAQLLRYIVPKGSVAVEGVSLTVVEKYRAGFSVALIPYTLTRTNLGEKRAGDAVNIECDMIAKYLGEMSAKHRHAGKRR